MALKFLLSFVVLYFVTIEGFKIFSIVNIFGWDIEKIIKAISVIGIVCCCIWLIWEKL